jgi:site-specific DNA recombinase
VVVEELCDDYSGASLDRPELNRLRELIAGGHVDVVIVYDIDRLARKSVYQLLIEEEFRKANVQIEYVIGQYDDSDEGRLQKHIRAAIAEYEKTKILERSKRGKRGKAKSGFVVVGARSPYGYMVKSEPHKSWLEIDNDEAKIVKLVYQLYLYGDGGSGSLSKGRIVARLTKMGIPTRGDKQDHFAKKRSHAVWSSGMIRHILRNEAYVGNWHYGKTVMVSDGQEHTRKQKNKCGLGKQVARPRDEWIEVSVPAIISREDYDKAQERMKMNIEQAQRSTRHEYLLSKRLRCSVCGYSYVGKTRNGKHQYYNCKGREQQPEPLCSMPYFRVDQVDDAIWGWVRSLLEDTENLQEGLRGLQEETRRQNQALYDRLDLIKEQLESNQQQLEKLLDLYLAGAFSKEVLLERKDRLETTITNLRKEEDQLTSHLGSITYSDQDLVIIEEFCAHIRENLEYATFEGKRRILELLDVRGTLAVEDDQKVVYVSCLITPQPVSLVLTLPLSSTGAIATTPYASHRTARFR